MRSKYFKIEELVDKTVHGTMKDRAWSLIDSRLIESIDTIKENFPKGTITINNWVFGGNREWSGLRTFSSPYFSQSSQHTFGRAVDMVFSHYDVNDVRNAIMSNIELYPHIRGIELDVSWLHIDVRNHDTLLKFKA